jgi:hypothetical protein
MQVKEAKGDVLDLSGLDLDELPIEAVKMPNVKSLCLKGNNLEKLAIKGSNLLPNMTSLTSLDLSANPWGTLTLLAVLVQKYKC